MPQDKFSATFRFRNSTKRCYRFEQTDGEQVGTLYVKQSAFSTQPKVIKATVEVVE